MTEEKRDAASQKLGAHFKWTSSVLGVVASIVTLLGFVVPGDRMKKIASGAVITVLITCLIEFMRFCARKRGKFLKLSCPYLISAAVLAGGVWWVYRSFLDWILAALLWITSTATACFVIRERRARRQAKERRQVIDGLSDAAVELIVATLEKRGPIYRHEERVVFSAGTVKGEVNKPFICSLTPEKTPTANVLLDELVEARLLQKRSDDGYEVASHARKQAEHLRERDFFRIQGALPGPAKRLLDLIENRDEVLGFEVFGSESTTFLANEKTGKFSHPLFPYPVDEIKRTILALQALCFVETWEPRKTVGEFNQATRLNPLLASFTQESLDVFWQNKGCLAGSYFDCLIGRLTDKGWEFVKKLQG